MYIIQRDFTRPSVDVPFYEASAEYKAAWASYKETGKLLGNRSTLSEDGLTRTAVSLWKDEETWKEYSSDPLTIQMILQRDEYHQLNNITSTRAVKNLTQ
jgi:DNA phosphorothioation-dependent restriction protein DptG